MGNRRASLGLRQQDRVGTAGNNRVEIGIGHSGVERIDADHQQRAGIVFLRVLQKRERCRARRLLALGGDRVLEIQDQRVRAAAEGFGELLRAVAGHEQRGADRRFHRGRMRMNACRWHSATSLPS